MAPTSWNLVFEKSDEIMPTNDGWSKKKKRIIFDNAYLENDDTTSSYDESLSESDIRG